MLVPPLFIHLTISVVKMVSIIIILKWHLQFSKKDIEVEVADGVLTIRSVKENEEDDSNLYRGISCRKFNRKFTLADDIIVKDAKLQDGLLKISLEKIIQEEKARPSK